MDGQRSDQELMMAYGAGDAGAFGELYARHKAPLYRYFKRQCHVAEQADELFQETWARVIKARERYEATAKFTTWLYHIAHNLLMDYGRKQVRTPHLVAVNHDDEPVSLAAHELSQDQLADAALLQQRLLQALEQLPEDQRSAFLLKEEGGLSLIEIGEVLGVGRETVKSRLRYATQKLRAALAAEQQAYL
jgi:RNA polymerase sigma-70 factor (ECF subfamily)